MMKNKNLISISGKKGSGKDTVGKIIQLLANNYKVNEIVSLINNNAAIPNGGWHIKKWAGAVKEICAIILGVPVSKFEDQEFKASELSEEWWYYYLYKVKYPYSEHKGTMGNRHLVKPTVRWLLQNIGTEVGRTIHPNMWVNVLMNKYKTKTPGYEAFIGTTESQWIITDTRFENELKAIQDKGGICVKVKRSYGIFMNKSRAEKINKEGFEHPSETSLDHVKEWDWIFHNNGSVGNLVEQVKEFLKHIKII